MTDSCPHCHADLTAAPIPKAQREWYGTHTHFSRKIGHVDPGLDRIVAWECPDCGKRWER